VWNKRLACRIRRSGRWAGALALARTNPARSVISDRLTRFYTRCAGPGLPELERLASTVSTWWPQILAFLPTGVTNAGSEGTNRVIKTVARDAYGFRNPENQRLRTRCATTRKARGYLPPLNFEPPACTDSPASG
jgi:transposase